MEEGLQFRQIRCTALQIVVLVVLLTCQHNQMPTASSLKELFQLALSFFLFFQFFILNSYYPKNINPLTINLFQPNPVHTYTYHFLKIHRNFCRCKVCEIRRSVVTSFSHVRLILPSGLLSSGFHTKIPYMLLYFPYALHDSTISFFSIL